MKVPILHLSSFDEIEQLGMEWYSLADTLPVGGDHELQQHHGWVKHIHKYTKRKTDHIQFDLYPSKLRIPTDDTVIPHNEQDDDSHPHSPTVHTSPFYQPVVTSDMDGALVYIGKNKKQYSAAQREHDVFAININWASTNNPDGVPIVNDPIDQVKCENASCTKTTT
jgi:hypothetical protein